MDLLTKAIFFATKAHEGQMRKMTNTPYILHPIEVASIIATITDDQDIMAAGVLHDVIEDCGKTLDDLPVNDETKEIVRLMTHAKTNDEDRDKVMQAYYDELVKNPKAALVKCMDRCNNLTTMSWGLSRDRVYRMILETEKYYPALLKSIKSTIEYDNAAWLLQYQIESMLDIYKRLM